MLTEVPLPVWDPEAPEGPSAHIRDQLESWFRSDALRVLVEASNASPPDSHLGLRQISEWYQQFSGKNWDFRGGQERDLADRPSLPQELSAHAQSAATALGLTDTRAPSRNSYDHILILGGLIRACIVRPRCAARLLTTGLRAEEVTALGAYRPLSQDELHLAEAMGVVAENEIQAMRVGVSRAFTLGEDFHAENPHSSGRNTDWQVLRLSGRFGISIVVAPSPVEARRANTMDTLRWWADRTGPMSGKRILVVTSQIYVPYQGATVTEVLGIGAGAAVETIGATHDDSDLGEFTQEFRPDQYLQEIRSAVNGFSSLVKLVIE